MGGVSRIVRWKGGIIISAINSFVGKISTFDTVRDDGPCGGLLVIDGKGKSHTFALIRIRNGIKIKIHL